MDTYSAKIDKLTLDHISLGTETDLWLIKIMSQFLPRYD
jgi:hypothetical protein